MRAVAAGLSDIGKERNQNEDRYILLPEFNVYVVADGMGGHQSGEVASRMAANGVASFFRRANGSRATRCMGDLLRDAVSDANAKIFARADDSSRHRGMGTTIVAAGYAHDERKLYVAHAGDSRCYRIRGDAIEQLTRDHSLVAEAMLAQPWLSDLDLAYLPRNVITRALGIGPTVDVDLWADSVEIGDQYLLCSDGLHGLVSEIEMIGILDQARGLMEGCARLVERANRAGGRDNITAVLIRIEEDDAPWSRRTPLPRFD